MDSLGSDRGQIVNHPARLDLIGRINAVLRPISLGPGKAHAVHRDAGDGVLIKIRPNGKIQVVLEISVEEDWALELLDHWPVKLIDPSIEEDDKCVIDKELWLDERYPDMVWVSFYIDRLGGPGYIELVPEGDRHGI